MKEQVYVHDDLRIQPQYGYYSNGRKVLSFNVGFAPYITASVNMPDNDCPDDEMHIKDYSENKGITKWLIENGFIEEGVTGMVEIEYVTIKRYKICKEHLKNWN